MKIPFLKFLSFTIVKLWNPTKNYITIVIYTLSDFMDLVWLNNWVMECYLYYF